MGPRSSPGSASTASAAPAPDKIRRPLKTPSWNLNRPFHADATMEVTGPSIMKCKICNARKPRRYCPGVAGDICSICCGSEREVTVSCPLDCPYLIEARLHEKARQQEPQGLVHPDVRVTEDFLRDHEPLLLFMGANLLEAS